MTKSQESLVDRIYLDHNATTPLAPAVTRWLTKGDFFWANPASQHSSGKKAAHALDEARQSLYKTFSLTEKTFNLVYHSGATEAINSAVWSWQHSTKKPLLFVYSPLDHSCVRQQASRLKAQGIMTAELVVDLEGDLNLEESVNLLSSYTDHSILINFTWVHNETGVVWPLEWAEILKQKTHALIHVDAAQAIGKVADCWSLSAELDYYSFSSHKCGGLKSHGFSFIKTSWVGEPLIIGGGQQKGMRSGTENVMGAQALQLALAELKAEFKPYILQKRIDELRVYFDERLEGRGLRIAQRAQHLNLNTVFFVLNKLPSDLSLPIFDLHGLEVSAGAACASGAAKASHVLQGLGLERHAKNGLRLSVGLWHDDTLQQKLLSQLGQVFDKIS